jgi:carboxyl-terminal processing protease
MRKCFIFSLILLFSAILYPLAAQSQDRKQFEISKNFDVLHALFRELEQLYVDSVKPEKSLSNAIAGLMSSYDPYTNYIAEAQTDELKFMTTGEYGGVGAIIGQRNGRVLVLEPYGGLPAQKTGLTYGDVLLEIGGVKMQGENMDRASDLLRGQPGTEVEVVYLRDGNKKPVRKKILRELVQINPVTWYGFVDSKIGYINLNSFTTKSSQEVHKAFVELKTKGAEQLILDLRGNGGGLLDEAVSICNLFIPKGQEIVSTRGKDRQLDKVYKTTREPVDTVMPLLVLVNSGSASSSEIVAGALQDLDRAAILGSRTYGKGLVQTTRSMPYNGILKVTTAKYYIPSGRCIQAIDYSNRNEDGSVGRIPDSLTHVFSTMAGRKVKDGGGILPDFECEDIKGSDISLDLLDSMCFFEYANNYYREHDKIAPLATFKLTDSDFINFLSFVKSRGFTFTSSSKKMVERLRQELEKDHLIASLDTELKALETKLFDSLDADFEAHKDEIEYLLSAEIASRYYYQAGELEQSLKFDPFIKRSKELFANPETIVKALRP